MSLESLYSSYLRYKADTDAVATWLLNTARGRGYNIAHRLESADQAAKGPRLKGKARTLARAAANDNDKANTQTYRIKINDFVALAQHIAKANKPRVRVPHSFVLELRQCIKTRKSHQAWYEKRCEEKSKPSTSDCGHAHFIRTLESVMEILRPMFPEASCLEEKHDTIGGPPLANMFEHLAIEETSETASHSAADPLHSARTRITATVESTGGEREQEAYIASTFLSYDAHRLRGVVETIWKLYHKGLVNLVAASITTNTAIDFCRKLQEGYEKAFPGQKKWHERNCLYCVFLADTNAPDANTMDQDRPCLMSVYRILRLFLKEIQDDSPTVMHTVAPGNIHSYLQEPQYTSGNMEDKLHGDMILLLGILPELAALILATPECDRLQAEHEIIRAMRHLLSYKTQTLWVTFAFQVLLDTRHILREDITCAFDDLCRGAKLIKSNVESVLAFHREVGVTGFSQSNDQALSEVLQLVRRWTESDHVSIMIDRERRLVDPSIAKHVPQYYLLKRDPLWCGTLLYNFRTVAHEGAIIEANSWPFILAAAHLYNSLGQSSLLTCRWDDMERVISMHGAGNLFVGAIPTTSEDCVKRFALACGMPAEELARNRRQRNSLTSFSKGRRLEKLAPVSRFFKGRYCDADGRTSLEPSSVVEVLRQKALKEGDEYSISSSGDLYEILVKLGHAIERETLQVTFNHLKMHILCWKMLRQLRTATGTIFLEFSKEYRNDRNLPVLVFEILTEATRGNEVGALIASEVMASFVIQEGGVAQRDIRALLASMRARTPIVSDGVSDQSDADPALVV